MCSNLEIERKFLLNYDEECYKGYLSSAISQQYLNFDPEVRLRQELRGGVCKFSLCCKSGSGLVRQEFETGLNVTAFNSLSEPYKDNLVIRKKRYEVPLEDGNIAYVDEFADIRLKLVEVEFDSVESADTFAVPDWFGVEVTLSPLFKNSVIAKLGYESFLGLVSKSFKLD